MRGGRQRHDLQNPPLPRGADGGGTLVWLRRQRATAGSGANARRSIAAPPEPPPAPPVPSTDPNDRLNGTYSLTADLGASCRSLLGEEATRRYEATIAPRAGGGYVVTLTRVGLPGRIRSATGTTCWDAINSLPPVRGTRSSSTLPTTTTTSTAATSWSRQRLVRGSRSIGKARGRFDNGSTIDASGTSSVWYCSSASEFTRFRALRLHLLWLRGLDVFDSCASKTGALLRYLTFTTTNTQGALPSAMTLWESGVGSWELGVGNWEFDTGDRRFEPAPAQNTHLQVMRSAELLALGYFLGFAVLVLVLRRKRSGWLAALGLAPAGRRPSLLLRR